MFYGSTKYFVVEVLFNDSELLSIEYESNEIEIKENTIKFSFGNTLTFDKIVAIRSQGQYIIIETGSMEYVIKCKSYNEANEIKNLLPINK